MTPVMLPSAERPTLATLLAHAERYGLDSRDGLKRPTRYTAFKAFNLDALVEVGLWYLGVEAFILLVEGLGYGHWRTESRAAWHAHRGEEVPT